MKKKILQRVLFGAPLGLAISYFITIVISLGWADGTYLACMPELVVWAGNEIRAVAVQAFVSCLVGAGFGGSSVVWEVERWELAQQTGVYFFLISLFMLPAAYAMHWMEHSLTGFVQYAGLFVLLFILMWLVELAIGRYNVRRLNARLTERQSSASSKPER